MIVKVFLSWSIVLSIVMENGFGWRLKVSWSFVLEKLY